MKQTHCCMHVVSHSFMLPQVLKQSHSFRRIFFATTVIQHFYSFDHEKVDRCLKDIVSRARPNSWDKHIQIFLKKGLSLFIERRDWHWAP